ncbi:hypothetical protein BN946_scf184985.g97 [Trametes cinnabarina]|uniref:Uncharacterized protein n=1 Tax=Pycnoporus cinnabarinus TaxID=5643 RepID=A0A060SDV2_PYCCI|nr:hypothetical protein BN946_scf184985.g97 [Trametes cinnabarina]
MTASSHRFVIAASTTTNAPFPQFPSVTQSVPPESTSTSAQGGTSQTSSSADQPTAPAPRSTTVVIFSTTSAVAHDVGLSSDSETTTDFTDRDSASSPSPSPGPSLSSGSTTLLAPDSSHSTTTIVTSSDSPKPSLSLSSFSVPSTLGHSSGYTAPARTPSTLPSPGSHAPSKLVIAVCAALALIVLTIIIGLILVCKRRRRYRHLRASSAGLSGSMKNYQDGDGATDNDEATHRSHIDVTRMKSALALTHPPSGGTRSLKPVVLIPSYPRCTSPHAPSVVSPALASQGSPVANEGHIHSTDAVNPSHEARRSPPPTSPPTTFPLNATGEDTYARSSTVTFELALSDGDRTSSISETTAVSSPASHVAVNQHHDDEKNVSSQTAERQGRSQHSQDHPYPDGPPAPSVQTPTATRDTNILLPVPMRFSAACPPHSRFVAVLMEIEPDTNSDEPPPYHPARVQDAPAGLS